jgi:hypothetical protein
LINLCDVLVVQGRDAEAKQVVAAELNKIPPEFRRPELNSFFEKPLKYLVGEFAAPDAAPVSADGPLNDWDFHEWLLTGRVEQAAQDARFARILKEAWNQLALSNAFYLAGNPQAASQWRDRACEVFEKGGHDEQRSAALLRGQQPATSEALNEIALPPRVKAQVVAALTWIDPERSTQLAAFARQLNVSRIPPHRLVEAVLAKVAP